MRAGRGLITRYTGESPSPKAHLRGRNVVSMGLGVAAVFDATKWAKKVVFDMEMPRPGETDADCPRETARESLAVFARYTVWLQMSGGGGVLQGESDAWTISPYRPREPVRESPSAKSPAPSWRAFWASVRSQSAIDTK